MITPTFPKSELEFYEQFATEEACYKYLYELKWPKGWKCPCCGYTEFWPRRQDREGFICAARGCGKETTLRAGTVLHNSRKPLRMWFIAMFHMTTNKQALSAVRLQKIMGFGSINTAIRWLRELRRAMTTRVEQKHILSGEVEADEAHIAGKREGGKRGRGAHPDRMLVLVEKVSTGCGQARIKYLKGDQGSAIRSYIKETVAKKSLILTDGSKVYQPLSAMDYYPDSRILSDRKGKSKGRPRKLEGGTTNAALVHLPRVHRVISLVKRVMLGAYQGRYSERHVQSYFDEYCFRFNRRKDPRPFALFQRLADSLFLVKAVPYWKSSGRPYNKPADGKDWYVADQKKKDRIAAWRALAKETN